MNRKITFIKIGRVVRFDKNKIDKFFNIESRSIEHQVTIPNQIKDTATWLSEQSKRFNYADISVRVVIHDGKIKQVYKTVTEKIK